MKKMFVRLAIAFTAAFSVCITPYAAAATTTTTVQTKTVGLSKTKFDGYTIIANTNTKKYHRPSCSSVGQMKESNKGYSNDSSYLESNGYKACKKCH
jgi:DNA-entry nuclease